MGLSPVRVPWQGAIVGREKCLISTYRQGVTDRKVLQFLPHSSISLLVIVIGQQRQLRSYNQRGGRFRPKNEECCLARHAIVSDFLRNWMTGLWNLSAGLILGNRGQGAMSANHPGGHPGRLHLYRDQEATRPRRQRDHHHPEVFRPAVRR